MWNKGPIHTGRREVEGFHLGNAMLWDSELRTKGRPSLLGPWEPK